MTAKGLKQIKYGNMKLIIFNYKADVFMMVCNCQKWKVYRNVLYKKTVIGGSIYCSDQVQYLVYLVISR